jgi:hypothetical protein
MAMSATGLELIESRELDVECRPCGWTESRTIAWLLTHRDMECPNCLGIIVLNTSDMKDRMRHLRRQVSDLRRHLGESIGDSKTLVVAPAARLSNSARSAQGQFALRLIYGETSGRSVNTPKQARRERR